MTRGIKSASTNKQKRQARRIEASVKERGYSGERAAQIEYATVNTQEPGGKKSGRARSKKSTRTSNRAGSHARRRGGAGSRGARARAGRAARRR